MYVQSDSKHIKSSPRQPISSSAAAKSSARTTSVFARHRQQVADLTMLSNRVRCSGRASACKLDLMFIPYLHSKVLTCTTGGRTVLVCRNSHSCVGCSWRGEQQELRAETQSYSVRWSTCEGSLTSETKCVSHRLMRALLVCSSMLCMQAMWQDMCNARSEGSAP
jgi:hypothetical protein